MVSSGLGYSRRGGWDIDGSKGWVITINATLISCRKGLFCGRCNLILVQNLEQNIKCYRKLKIKWLLKLK